MADEQEEPVSPRKPGKASKPVLEQVVRLVVKFTAGTTKEKPKAVEPCDPPEQPQPTPPTTPSGKTKGKPAPAPKTAPKKDAAKDVAPNLPTAPLSVSLKLPLWDGTDMRSEVLQWQVLEENAETITYSIKTELHAKLTVNEKTIRAMAACQGWLRCNVQILEAAAAAPKAGQAAPEGQGQAAVLSLDCCSFLYGESQAEVSWPEHPLPLPGELKHLQTCQLSAQVITLPSKDAAAAAAPAAAKKGGKGGPAEMQMADLPGDPIVLMPRDLAVRLNPVVVRPLEALCVPDAPATCLQLDSACHPVKLRLSWPAGQPCQEQIGSAEEWHRSNDADCNVRNLSFHGHSVFLAGDDISACLMACREWPMMVELHDRDARPDPPMFYIPQGESQDDDEPGYVCGLTRVSLQPLALGACSVDFELPMQPYTTVRGAGNLDWKSRPGNYMEAQTVLRGQVVTACPLLETLQLLAPEGEKKFSRALFLFDYRDSDLLHVLEDLLRLHNAKVLGLNKRKESLLANRFPGADQGADHPSVAGTHEGGLAKEASFSQKGKQSRAASIAASTTNSVAKSPPGRAGTDGQGGGRGSPKREGSVTGRKGEGGARSLSPNPGIRTMSPSPADVDDFEDGRGGSMSLADKVKRRAGTPPMEDQEHVRFHKSVQPPDSSSVNDEEEEPPTEADLRLEEMMAPYQDVELDMQLLQSLTTYQATPDQCSASGVDLLSGMQLVDGAERMVILEGHAEGAMVLVQGVAEWALAEQKPLPGMRVRQVILNNDHRFSGRLYDSFGVDLWIVKLRNKLTKLVADAGSYAAGQVRVDCIEGLRRFGQLRLTEWARQAAALQLWPTSAMVNLVDKKFGGELTKGDVFGIEAEEEEDSEDGGPEAHGPFSIIQNNDDARSSRSGRSAGSRRSRSLTRSLSKGSSRRSGMSGSKKPKKRLRSYRQPPLDMDNEAYLHLRAEMHAQRLGRNFMQENVDALAQKEAAASGLRETWKAWNPQHEAQQQLAQMVATGELSVQDTLRRERHKSELPGDIAPEEALARNWYPHTGRFRWPAPRDPAAFKAHPGKPSQFRVEELQQAWEEGANHKPLLLRGAVPGAEPFRTAIHGEASGLFGTDPEYWKTVHLGGDGWEKEQREAKQREAEEWKSHVVVDDLHFHAVGHQRSKPSQTDRLNSMLWHQPQKKAIKDCFVPPAPVSMHLAEPHKERGLAGITRDSGDVKDFTSRGKDFNRHIARDKTSLHKPGMNQSWSAAVNDFAS